jgi:hypothetical protein
MHFNRSFSDTQRKIIRDCCELYKWNGHTCTWKFYNNPHILHNYTLDKMQCNHIINSAACSLTFSDKVEKVKWIIIYLHICISQHFNLMVAFQNEEQERMSTLREWNPVFSEALNERSAFELCARKHAVLLYYTTTNGTKKKISQNHRVIKSNYLQLFYFCLK